jgi:phosphoribosyl-ATP pyrophosphohydrolase/phosphoribosyl-AMP cyclohydrolase
MGSFPEIKFDSSGLVPAVAQDAGTGEVLMLAYMNREAIEKTLETGRAHYYSRSRGELWLKGETSGNFQDVSSILYDCDADAILLKVTPLGPACHTGERTCFYRAIRGEAEGPPGGAVIISALYDIIRKRSEAPEDKSYVASLYAKGLTKILEKVREESGELIEAAETKDNREVIHELADLWFHTMVLLGFKGVEMDEVFSEFRRRFGTSGIEEKKSRGKGPE